MKRGLLLALVLWGAPEAASAETFRCSRSDGNSGPSLRWDVRDVPWGVEPSTLRTVKGGRARVLETIEAAFAAWAEESCSDMSFRFVGADARFVPGFDEDSETRNAVALTLDWPYDPGLIAVTVTTFSEDGVLRDADIELNGDDFDFALADDACEGAQIDLGNAMTHEVGHLLGLAHPPQTPSNAATTMFATSQPCETAKRSLSRGDVQGLCTIYPSAAPTQVCHAADDLGFELVDRDEGFGGCAAAGFGAFFPSMLLVSAYLLRRLV